MTSRRLFQDVAEQSVALIEQGAFPPQSRLPGERELSERLGVSRVMLDATEQREIAEFKRRPAERRARFMLTAKLG